MRIVVIRLGVFSRQERGGKRKRAAETRRLKFPGNIFRIIDARRRKLRYHMNSEVWMMRKYIIPLAIILAAAAAWFLIQMNSVEVVKPAAPLATEESIPSAPENQKPAPDKGVQLEVPPQPAESMPQENALSSGSILLADDSGTSMGLSEEESMILGEDGDILLDDEMLLDVLDDIFADELDEILSDDNAGLDFLLGL